MKLNHADLQVSNVSEAREFFETYFDLHCPYQRGEEMAMLTDDAGFSLGVSNLFDSPPPKYPPDFHIGFVLDSENDVREMYQRLSDAGLSMKAELAHGGPNIYFTCLGPDSIPVEVSAPRK